MKPSFPSAGRLSRLAALGLFLAAGLASCATSSPQRIRQYREHFERPQPRLFDLTHLPRANDLPPEEEWDGEDRYPALRLFLQTLQVPAKVVTFGLVSYAYMHP